MKIILSITMIMMLLSYTAALKSNDDERCGTQGGGRTCYDHRCCSHHGYCGTDERYCLPKNDCQSNCWTGPGASNVTALWANYNAKQHNYDLNIVKTECSSLDADKPYAWRSKYGWTAFCGPAGPRGQEACGKCLRVKNIGTDAVVLKLRIVDECGDGGLNLDKEMFNLVDSDGKGNALGHINVDYQFIDCDDKASEKPDFKNILGSVVDNV